MAGMLSEWGLTITAVLLYNKSSRGITLPFYEWSALGRSKRK